jgi:hypothetical protein
MKEIGLHHNIISFFLSGQLNLLIYSNNGCMNVGTTLCNIFSHFFLNCSCGVCLFETSLCLQLFSSMRYAATRVRQQYRSHYSSCMYNYAESFSRISSSLLHCGLLSYSCIRSSGINSRNVQIASTHSITIRQVRCTTRNFYTFMTSCGGFVCLNGYLSIGRYAQASCAWQYYKFRSINSDVSVEITPSLRVVADGVSCAHGCVISLFHSSFLFYFRSRGVDSPTSNTKW